MKSGCHLALPILTPASARVVLAWEKIRLSFKVEINTLAKLQASTRKLAIAQQCSTVCAR